MTNDTLDKSDYQLLDELVIKLHYVAGVIESTLGKGKLSQDVRSCADRLAEIVKKT